MVINMKSTKKDVKFTIKVAAYVYIAWCVGGMLDFSFFLANSLVVREIGYCTLLLCIVISMCTNRLISNSSSIKSKDSVEGLDIADVSTKDEDN